MEERIKYVAPTTSIEQVEYESIIAATTALQMNFSSTDGTEEALSNESSCLWESEEWDQYTNTDDGY